MISADDATATRHHRLAFAAGLALLLAASAAGAATPLGDLAVSPDVTLDHVGTVADDEDVLGLSSSSSPALVDLGALPQGADLTAYHRLANGDQLFSLDVPAVLGSTLFLPGDVIRYDGVTYALEFDAAANGVGAGVSLDALSEEDGDLLLSFDASVVIEGVMASPEDVLQFTPGVPPTVALRFDGSGQGVPVGVNLDAVSLLAGAMLISFDGSGSIGGVAFDDEDVLEFDASGPTWELALDLDATDADWGPADLDALWARSAAEDNCKDVWNPDQADSEPDGLGDACDPAVGDPDADDDGLPDGAEVFVYGTDPTDADTDDDGLLDGDEVANFTDPLSEDPDADGICDGALLVGTCTQAGPDNCPNVGNPSQANSDAFPAGDPCQCGNVDGAGGITAADYDLAREAVVKTPGGSFDPDFCDVNGDAACDVEDLFVLDRVVNAQPATLLDACPGYRGQ